MIKVFTLAAHFTLGPVTTELRVSYPTRAACEDALAELVADVAAWGRENNGSSIVAECREEDRYET